MKNYLVIGCGNTLRGDDGLGPHITENLRHMPELCDVDVRIMTVPQLDLILVSPIHQTDVLIFVDARIDESEEFVKIEKVEPSTKPQTLQHTFHTITISALLRIAIDLYGAAPLCYAVMPKGYDFSLGDTISEKARITATYATDKVIEIVRMHTCTLR